jgi:hypothetical protein
MLRITQESAGCPTRRRGMPSDHGLSSGFHITFQVTGGTTYSGVSTKALYNVASTPTTKTFTIQAFGLDGLPGGSNVNAGSAGSKQVAIPERYRLKRSPPERTRYRIVHISPSCHLSGYNEAVAPFVTQG